jgi:hypothetical protein
LLAAGTAFSSLAAVQIIAILAISRRRSTMPSHDRRAACGRRAWGRGPIKLRLESLEGRQLLSAASNLPDLVNSSLATSNSVSDWAGTVEIGGQVKNQGRGVTTAPFSIEFYASPIRGIDKYAVPIGSVTIPPGLGAGQTADYQTSLTLPSSPIPDVNSNGGTLHIDAIVNPNRTVAESNYANNEDLGPPYDSVPVMIEAPYPAELVGTTFAVTPTSATWGSTITVTAQVTNKGAGPSPQTRALISLTPAGLNFGDSTTVGIGNITIPPLAPYQTINLVQNITLPAVEPVAISNYTSFGLTMTQDADYLTNDLYPHGPTQGLGYDQAPITITANPNSTATTPPLPDLAASSILQPQHTLDWGSSFPVSTAVQNVGAGPAPPFYVFFLLTGQSGSLSSSIFLGETVVNGLAPGAVQTINQTLMLPTRLPSGVSIGSIGYGRVSVLIDPQSLLNEALRSNSNAISAPFLIRLPGNAATVPTEPAPGAVPSVSQLASSAKQQAKLELYAKRVAAMKARHPALALRKLHRRRGVGNLNVTKAAINVGTEVTKLPNQIFNKLKSSI